VGLNPLNTSPLGAVTIAPGCRRRSVAKGNHQQLGKNDPNAAAAGALPRYQLATQAPALTCPRLPVASTQALPSGGGGGGATTLTHTPALLRTCPDTQTSARLTAGDAMVTTAAGAASAITAPAVAAQVRIQ
jgi:hypothetical protein